MSQLAFNLSDPWLPVNFDYTALSEDERRVYNALYFHQGAEAAVKVEALALEAFPFGGGNRERVTREIVKTLTEERKIAIASSCRAPYGVYLVVNADELLDYTTNLKARAMSMLRRAASLRKVSLPVYLGQIAASLEASDANGKG